MILQVQSCISRLGSNANHRDCRWKPEIDLEVVQACSDGSLYIRASTDRLRWKGPFRCKTKFLMPVLPPAAVDTPDQAGWSDADRTAIWCVLLRRKGPELANTASSSVDRFHVADDRWGKATERASIKLFNCTPLAHVRR